MRTYLLSGAQAMVVAQAAAPANKISFTGFGIGAAYYAANATPVGNELVAQPMAWYTGTVAQMQGMFASNQEASVVMYISRLQAQQPIGNLVIYAALPGYLAGAAIPFIMMTAEPGVQNLHLMGANSAEGISYTAGMDLYVTLNLLFPNAQQRFSVANLLATVAGFEVFDTQWDVTNPLVTDSDQIFIEEHTLLERPVVAFNIGSRWQGFALREDGDPLHLVSGGQTGDGYK